MSRRPATCRGLPATAPGRASARSRPCAPQEDAVTRPPTVTAARARASLLSPVVDDRSRELREGQRDARSVARQPVSNAARPNIVASTDIERGERTGSLVRVIGVAPRGHQVRRRQRGSVDGTRAARTPRARPASVWRETRPSRGDARISAFAARPWPERHRARRSRSTSEASAARARPPASSAAAAGRSGCNSAVEPALGQARRGRVAELDEPRGLAVKLGSSASVAPAALRRREHGPPRGA